MLIFLIDAARSDVIQNSNTMGYVTSNFIGQLHLQVRVNFAFYHVGNCVNMLIWSDTH